MIAVGGYRGAVQEPPKVCSPAIAGKHTCGVGRKKNVGWNDKKRDEADSLNMDLIHTPIG